MRSLSANLTAAQAFRAPQQRVTCTVEQRGLTPDATPWVWTELVSNSTQSSNWRVTAAVCLSDGTTILRAPGAEIAHTGVPEPAAVLLHARVQRRAGRLEGSGVEELRRGKFRRDLLRI